MYNGEEEAEILAEVIVGSNGNRIPEEKHENLMSDIERDANAIPEVVEKFLTKLAQNIRDKSVFEIYTNYDSAFNRITEKYYQNSYWPSPDLIKQNNNIIGEDEPIILILYKELYYRHIYTKLQLTLEDRVQSYENYCDLFNYILNSDGPVNIELPNQWIWDIIDEFIYQFQSYCQFRSRLEAKGTKDELEAVRSVNEVWSCYSVLNVLYSLIRKSRINEQLIAQAKGEGEMEEAAGEYGGRALYRMLGYFSLVGFQRLSCLLGDYMGALRVLDQFDFSKKALFYRVSACHVTLYYYTGFAYMMQRRYADAIKTFTQVQLFIARTKQYQQRGNQQHDQIGKKCEQMYALLAVCIALCPTRLDDTIHGHLREKYGEHMGRMQCGEEALGLFEELFLFGCPKFINPVPWCEGNQTDMEPHLYQARIFVMDLRFQLQLTRLRSFLKLYSSISVAKLAGFLDEPEDQVRRQLLVYKQRNQQFKWNAECGNGALLSGELVAITDLDFAIAEGDVVRIAENRVARRYADWFVRNIVKCSDLIEAVECPVLVNKQ